MKKESYDKSKEKKMRTKAPSGTAPVAIAAEDRQSPRLSRNMIVETSITAIDDDGYGTARVDGVSFKIGGALPGDVVRAKIDHVSFGNVVAHLHKLLQPSPLRSKRPPCSNSAECLGCPLIAMRYVDQKVWKRGMVLNELAKYPALSGITVHPLLSPDRLIHYRNSAKLIVAGKHSEPFLGIYRRSSHDVFDLEACPIHHPLINRVMETVRRGITKLKVPIYNPRSKMGLLRYLVVRVSESEQKAMVVLITADKSYNEIHHLSRFIREALPEVEVIASNVNSSEGNVIFGQKDTFLTTKRFLTERVGDVSVQISPRSFFQVNSSGAHMLYEKVREWAAPDSDSTVLDLYCGIGGIGLFLAGQARKIIGIEVVEEAVADARKNARLNGFTNCRFEAGDAAELLEELADDGEKVDVVVLNPPRKGCDEQVLRRVADLSPARIIYVSCSPQTLMRDLDILKKLGYSCREIQPVDMFPQTVHVENVARLEKDDKSA
jgi:23S rRNA (uracil1939-C5)-methyltransferase